MTAATSTRVVIGCVPDADLGSNGRAHWAVKARKAKALRQFVYYSTREDAPEQPMTGPVQLTISVGWPKGRKRHDDDNMVTLCKSLVDGMTDAGYWRNDRQVTIRRPIDQQPWSQWEKQGGWLYPHGVISVEVICDNSTNEMPTRCANSRGRGAPTRPGKEVR